MRGRPDAAQKKRLVASLCVLVVVLCFLFVYYGSFFGFGQGTTSMEYGKAWKKLGSSYLGGDDDSDFSGRQDDSVFKLDDGDDVTRPKSYPVC